MSTRVLAALMMLALVSTHARAQQTTAGAIAGVVQDTTGAVLPGVTVEIASPALIEKVRTAVTDENGRYRVVDLRPGTYSAVFTLAGFTTVRREGIELTSGFTANVTAEMKVGDLSETIVVSGLTPLVDVQNVNQQRVVPREVLDTLPSGRQYYSMALLVPSVINRSNSGVTDNGGISGRDGQQLLVHGSKQFDFDMTIDGMSQTTLTIQALNLIGVLPADGIAEEVSVKTGANPAEVDRGGVVINMVPKTGSNMYRGTVFANFSHSSLAGTNLTDALRAQGLPKAKAINHMADVNPTYGGPISRDRLWFFGSYRELAISRPSTWYPDANPTDWAYTPDTSKPPTADERPNRTADVRLTWQVSPRNKINGAVQYGWLCACRTVLGALGQTQISTPEASLRSIYHNDPYVQGTWNAPITNRLLVEAGGQFARGSYLIDDQPGSAFPGATEQSTGISFRSAPGWAGGFPNVLEYLNHRGTHQYLRTAVSYVTGTHAFKVGVQLWPGQTSWDYPLLPGAVPYRVSLLNATPTAVTFLPIPLKQNVSHWVTGAFAQDQWTVRRLTINAGVRFDSLDAGYSDQTAGATPLLPARPVTGASVLSLRDLSPRLGVAYDLFGNGRTALKASVNRYITPQGSTGFTKDLLSAASGAVTLTRTWSDANGDYVPQGDPTVAAANGELGPSPNAFWGQPVVTTRFDPEAAKGWGVRLFNWETSTSIQHQLLESTSINVGYYRRVFGNFSVADNLAVAPGDYDPYCVAIPADSRFPDGGGKQVCDLWDLKPQKLGQRNILQTISSKYGKQREHFNSVDVAIDMRLPRGVTLQGGLSTGTMMTDNCDIVTKVDNPSKRFCHQESPWLTQFKFLGSYKLPWQLDTAATFMLSAAGPDGPLFGQVANVLFTNAQVAPSLGRNLSAGANGTVSVNAITPGTRYPSRVRQLDLRVRRTFNVNRVSLKAVVDLYNLLNMSTVNTFNYTYRGAGGGSWLNALNVQPGRFAKFGLQLDF